ncbi:MAG: HDIG domain-containing protein [Anaerolineae bacterium]|nr:HDIG domain-containing protein [Anaerolineae bacterium]
MAKARVRSRWPPRLLALFAVLLAAGLGLILSSDLLLAQRLSIEPGQAANEDITAPRRIEFESEILTEAARRAALAGAPRIYRDLDRQVGRLQASKALNILNFVESVRADPYATSAYQRSCLAAIEAVQLSPQVISDTLSLSDDQWRAVHNETREVLARVMQEEIKSGQEDAARRSVRALIDFELNEPQTAIVNEIVSGLVVANRVYDAEATEAARAEALESVEPQMRVLKENQIIVRSNEIVTDLQIEALQAAGLLTLEADWVAVGGTFLFSLGPVVGISVYLWHNERDLLTRPHHLLLLLLLLLTFALLAKWSAPLARWQQYMLPLATLGMLVTVLFGVRLGLVSQVALCLIVLYLGQGRIDLFVYHLAGGLVGLFALRQVRRMNAFMWAGSYQILVNVVTAAAFLLVEGELGSLQAGQLALSSVANGALSAVVALGGYYLLGMSFNITTTLQLIDLARPTHPAMRELLLKAPGTYHHSIMVGNMAEQAAEAVGANALLARVGAFYHDIGKTVRPYFFTENQMEGSNPHDLLDPSTSAQIIRRHTSDGLDLARSRYHLPKAIQAFIAEHHGTSEIGFFYQKALQQYGEGGFNEADYRHYGPTPQSKETAIVMMADSCEAAVRSVHPRDPEALERLIEKIISNMLAKGQLDATPLTLREISAIKSSFVNTLQGAFHPRVRYPGFDEPAGLPAQEAGSAIEAGQGGADSLPAGEAEQGAARALSAESEASVERQDAPSGAGESDGD